MPKTPVRFDTAANNVVAAINIYETKSGTEAYLRRQYGEDSKEMQRYAELLRSGVVFMTKLVQKDDYVLYIDEKTRVKKVYVKKK